jgi:hypothetical protein
MDAFFVGCFFECNSLLRDFYMFNFYSTAVRLDFVTKPGTNNLNKRSA